MSCQSLVNWKHYKGSLMTQFAFEVFTWIHPGEGLSICADGIPVFIQKLVRYLVIEGIAPTSFSITRPGLMDPRKKIFYCYEYFWRVVIVYCCTRMAKCVLYPNVSVLFTSLSRNIGVWNKMSLGWKVWKNWNWIWISTIIWKGFLAILWWGAIKLWPHAK